MHRLAVVSGWHAQQYVLAGGKGRQPATPDAFQCHADQLTGTFLSRGDDEFERTCGGFAPEALKQRALDLN